MTDFTDPQPYMGGCPVCGCTDEMPRSAILNSISTKNGQAEVPLIFHWCRQCGVEVLLDEDSRENARAAIAARTQP